MAFSFSRVKTWSAGDTLTAADLNGEFDNIISNATPTAIGAQTLDATLTAIAALTLTQGGLFSATGADAPAILAKGAANTKLFMNAGATAPEWAAGVKLGTLTRNMVAESGDVAYTGVGFKASAIIFLAEVDATSIGIGLDDGTLHYCVYQSAAAPHANASASVVLYEEAAKNQIAIVKTMDADGFTLTWTKTGTTGAGTGNVYYLALR